MDFSRKQCAHKLLVGTKTCFIKNSAIIFYYHNIKILAAHRCINKLTEALTLANVCVISSLYTEGTFSLMLDTVHYEAT